MDQAGRGDGRGARGDRRKNAAQPREEAQATEGDEMKKREGGKARAKRRLKAMQADMFEQRRPTIAEMNAKHAQHLMRRKTDATQ